MNQKIKTILILLTICLLFLVSRIWNLTSLPVFGDEAIYVRWSQIIKSVDSLRFIPQTDGKQPLYMWFTALNLKFFSENYKICTTNYKEKGTSHDGIGLHAMSLFSCKLSFTVNSWSTAG